MTSQSLSEWFNILELFWRNCCAMRMILTAVQILTPFRNSFLNIHGLWIVSIILLNSRLSFFLTCYCCLASGILWMWSKCNILTSDNPPILTAFFLMIVQEDFVPWWIGHTRLILCAAYLCMELQNGIFLVKKLMQQGLCAFCLMTSNLEFLRSLAV